MANKNNSIYKDYKIMLLVPDKIKVLNKVKRSNMSSEYITEHMTEDNILDLKDLNKCFLNFKHDLIKRDLTKNLNHFYLTEKKV